MLGAALLGESRYAEAEPLIVSGYEGLKAREAGMPPAVAMPRLTEAAERILQLYQSCDKPDKSAEWRDRPKQPNPPGRELPTDIFAPR